MLLIRRLIIGSGAVGTVDLVSTLLAQKVGGALMDKLTLGITEDVTESVYAAQKMARLGILAMRLCRPVPFTEEDHPSVTRLVTEVIRR